MSVIYYTTADGKRFVTKNGAVFCVGAGVTPPCPSGFRVNECTETRVCLVWDSVDCDCYCLYRNGEKIADVSGTSYTDTTVEPNQVYTYALTARRVVSESQPTVLRILAKTTYWNPLPLDLITDRTANDVQRWRELRDKGWANMTDSERAEWETSLKGSYNYTDMNRVEEAVKYVAWRMTEIGYLVHPEVNLTWTMFDIPSKVDMDRYFGNVAKMRSLIRVYASTPVAPTTAKKLNYKAANDLEQILVDLDEILSRVTQSWFYSGDIFAGEV